MHRIQSKPPPSRGVSLRRLLGASLILLALARLERAEAAPIILSSPNSRLVAVVDTNHAGQLTWSLRQSRQTLIEPSPLGLNVDGQDLGEAAVPGKPKTRTIRERYPWRGGKRWAINHCRVAELPIVSGASRTPWTLELRVFNDGFAWRYRVPGQGSRRVKGENSTWTLPAGSKVWFQTDTTNYEGPYSSRPAESLPLQATHDAKTDDLYYGPPVTAELPQGGYLLVTEANLFRYSGMTLRPAGNRQLIAAFQDDPQGFSVDGEILSPWRVTVATADLQGLANSDLIPSLCDPPDPRLFPDGPGTDWIKTGRALVTWCVFGNDGAQWHRQKWFVDHCAAMGCEFLLVDGGWRTEKWGFLADGGDLWARLRELCDYAAAKRVSIVVWNAFPEGRDDGPGLTDPSARRDFFQRVRAAGAKGVKIDFFDSESKASIDAQEDLLRLSAEHQLTINFHGSQKTTGEVRTWPHQVTQEGIREQEYLLWADLPLPHYSALPFTRLAAGHGDFLPGYVRKKYLKNTSATFQMALPVIAHSSFLCWPDHPEDYEKSPFLELVKAMPVVWDETRVLAGSEIGRRAGFARRAGDTWYVGLINTDAQPYSWTLRLDFLGKGPCEATIYRDAPPFPEGFSISPASPVRRGETMVLALSSGGGCVMKIAPRSK